jgi:hypothetical protein
MNLSEDIIMAFETKTAIAGSKFVYSMAPTVKKFTLRDNGFTETASGNYQLVRPVDATPTSNEGYKLKVTVTRDLKTLKMSVTTKDGLRSVDIFKKEELKLNQEKYYFILDGLIDRGVLVKEEA